MADSSARTASCGVVPAEQVVDTNGKQGILKELDRPPATHCKHHARFWRKRPDRFGVCLGEALSIPGDLFESGS